MKLIQVALDLPVPHPFDYRLDGEIDGDPVGRLVKVPFGASGKTGKLGVVVGEIAQSARSTEKLKAAEPVAGLPALPGEWLDLCRFCAQYYHHPLGQVMAFALPPLLRRGKLPREMKRKPGAEAANGMRASTVGGGMASSIGAGIYPPAGKVPTADQRAAIDAIIGAAGFQTFLLHGVTGSGKTEVYLCAIEAALAKGGQALMLVPEIALTPQLEARVRDRFPAAHIVAAHSGVADAARAQAFLAALEGHADIVLGTRLAVFMPMPRLGLIVVDEEHDPSFKQQEGLRYSARDVAIWRARQRGIPIVLGSATPSLESFHHAASGRYRRLELPERAVAAAELPSVAIVDTRKQKLQDGLSAELIAAVSERFERGEQSLIFLNRRGYAPVLACPACGWISRCRRCAANLVLHLADKRLRCHHCGLETPIPRACPDCGNLDLLPFGRGTQRLEERLATLFPAARILRIDRDSADSPKKWQALLEKIHAGGADILVGTQMLAKGHDFPKLTLVGVVGSDAALFAADFRAPERLFAQLMQVGGRSGRHQLPGAVLIQTEYPDHPLYRALAGHDYAAFAAEQLAERAAAGFPPFSFQAILRADAPRLADALAFLKDAVSRAPSFDSVLLYDPVPMRLFRLKNRERAQLLVEAKSRPQLHAFLDGWLPTLYALRAPRGLRWHLDVDPLEY